MTLETVDLPGVEILAAGGPVHGRGSPPEGDFYSVDDLSRLADASRELADELRAPAKVGHGSGGPAVGYLENVRVAGDKLVADVRDVPRRFAELVRAGAYRARSVELSKATSQRTGKSYPSVVTGLAWLGDRLPAVQTLDDVVALYEADLELVRAYELAPAGSESGEKLIDDAIAYGLLNASGREVALRLYEAEPETVRAFFKSRGLDEIRQLEAWYHGHDPVRGALRWPDDDEEERRELAARLGVRLEDVI